MLDKTNWPARQRRVTRAVSLSSAAKNCAERITATWQKAVQSIIETGRLLKKAKHDLRHGEYLKMIEEELPFSARTAQRLVKIAEHPLLANATHASHLPASWATLYRLTEIPDDELARMLADGRVNADTERHDVEEIVERIKQSGLYDYAKLRAALNLLIDFMKYQNLDHLAYELNEENVEGIYVDLAELSKLPMWIKQLHAACERAEANARRDDA